METKNTNREARRAELDKLVREARKREAMELIDAAGLRQVVKEAVADALDEERKKRGNWRV
jgi:hypothetical protein